MPTLEDQILNYLDQIYYVQHMQAFEHVENACYDPEFRSHYSTSRTETAYIPIVVHKITRADQSGGAPESYLEYQLNQLNQAFKPFNLQFYFREIDLHSSDELYETSLSQISAARLLACENVHDDAMHLIISTQVQINLFGDRSAGFAFYGHTPEGQSMRGISIYYGTHESTWLHEFLHFLGLDHLYDTRFGLELADGSNALIAGDRILDTPAFPIDNPSTKNQNEGCKINSYTCEVESCPTDANDQRYSPNISNVMGPDQIKPCRDNTITEGQAQVVQCFLDQAFSHYIHDTPQDAIEVGKLNYIKIMEPCTGKPISMQVIQDAIEKIGEGGTIEITAGVYEGTLELKNVKNVKFVANGNVIFDGKKEGSVVDINLSTVTFDGIQFQNGRAQNGGGMRIFHSDVTLKNVRFLNNTASYGGALSIRDSKIKIHDSTFTKNLAYIYGGAIYSSKYSTVIVKDSKINNNQSQQHGGGLYSANTSDLSVTNVKFSENSAQNHGADLYLTLSQAPVDFTNCEFLSHSQNSSVLNSEIYLSQTTASFYGGTLKGSFAFQDSQLNFSHTHFVSDDSPYRFYYMNNPKKSTFEFSDVSWMNQKQNAMITKHPDANYNGSEEIMILDSTKVIYW